MAQRTDRGPRPGHSCRMTFPMQVDTRNLSAGTSSETEAMIPTASPTSFNLPPLPAALDAERITFWGVHCYVAGEGSPLVLVHSINAASSAAESTVSLALSAGT